MSSLLLPSVSYAHAFGQMYTLPLPTWMYTYAGALVVFISFILVGFFVGEKEKEASYPTVPLGLFTKNIQKYQIFFKILSIGFFVLFLLTAFFGVKEPTLNFSTIFFWLIFFLGYTYLTAIIGNTWNIVSPWGIISEVLEKLFSNADPTFSYPKRVGYFPSFVFFIAFIWIELFGIGANTQTLGALISIYSLIMIGGSLLVGRKKWLSHVDFFFVFFDIIGSASIIEVRQGKLFLRPPFARLVIKKAKSIVLLLFILFMLSSTAYDGFRASSIWWDVYKIFLPLESKFGDYGAIAIQTVLLIASLFIFFILYFIALCIMKVITKSKESVWNLCLWFSYSLAPIALVYHVAHYYTLLFIQGQSIISVISDPFGKGWNLFGTAGYGVNVGFISAGFIWHSQVLVIVIGHMVAVYISHVQAVSLFRLRKKALISQVPMLFLMVFYTMFGLWILSQNYLPAK